MLAEKTVGIGVFSNTYKRQKTEKQMWIFPLAKRVGLLTPVYAPKHYAHKEEVKENSRINKKYGTNKEQMGE